MKTSMHTATILLIINFIFVIAIIYGLFYRKQQKFLCSDPIPVLKPYSNLFCMDTPVVQTGILIKDIPKVDINKNFVIINALIWFKFNPSIVHLETLENFSFLNCINLEKKLAHLSVTQEETYVEYDVRISFSNIFDHLYFPINDHQISIVLVHEKLSTDEIIYDTSGTAIQFDKNVKAEDMNVIGGSVEAGYLEKINIAENNEKSFFYPAVMYSIFLKKNGLKNIRLIIIPLVLIFGISLVVCLLAALQPEQNYTSTGITTLTLIMAYRYVIMQISPKVSYNTLTENVYNLSLLFTFINFILLISVVTFEKKSFASEVLLTWAILSEPLYILSLIKIIYFKDIKLMFLPDWTKKQGLLNAQNITIFDLKHLFNPSLLFRFKTLFIKPKITFSNKNLLTLILQCKTLQEKQKASITDFDECIIINEWGRNVDHIMYLLEKLIQEKKLNDDLTLTSPQTFLIFNQHYIHHFKEWQTFLLLEFILYFKNPGHVYILQDPSTLLKILHENHQNLAENQLIRELKNLPNQVLIQQGSQQIILRSYQNKTLPKTQQAIISNLNSTLYASAQSPCFSNYIEKSILEWQMASEYQQQFFIGHLFHNKPGYLQVQHEHFSQWYSLFYNAEVSRTYPNIPIKQEINFYSSMDLNKSFASFSRNILRGLAIQFSQFNSKIMPHAKAIGCYTLNDNGEPQKALQNLDLFLRKSKFPPSILCPLGTNILGSFEHHIQKKDLVILFPLSGSNQYRHAQYDNLYFLRGSFIDEAKLLLEHAKNKRHTKKICIFYQNDDYGNDAVNGILSSLKEDFDAYLLLSHERNKLQFLDFTEQINDFRPESILFISAFAPTATFAHTLGLNRVAEMNLYAIASSAHHLYDYLKNLGIPLIRTHIVPPLHAHLEILQNYRAAIRKHPLPFHASDESLESFIAANIVSDMLEKTDFSLDPTLIENYFRSLKNTSFKGLKLDFNPLTRQIYHDIWIEDESSSFNQDGR